MLMARANRPFDPLPALTILGGVLWVSALVGFARPESDFRMFYDSGAAWRIGATPYASTHPNLNPPLVVAAVFTPLSVLPYPVAQAVWSLAGGLALVASVRVVGRTLQLQRRQVWWVVAILSVTYPAWLIWFQGQILWLLLYPFTRAWAALRTGQQIVGGLWLAPVIAVKPPFALMALLLPWRVWLTAGAVSASLTVIGIIWTGWSAWTAWLRLGGNVRWLAWPDNASLWGVLSRLHSGRLLGGALVDLSPTVIALTIALALTCAWWVIRERDLDRRVSLAVVWTMLVSPLGWVYYVPIGLGPFTASWPATRWMTVALGVFAIPLPLVYPLLQRPTTVRLLGSLYTVGLLCALVAWKRRASRRRTAH